MTATRTPSAAKLAVAVRGLREKSPELELAGSEPLAIIGIGCRFAGNVTDPDGLWDLMRERRNVAGEVPPDRFTREDLRGSSAAAAFEYCRGAFLQDIDRFDAQYFGVAPREAALMDPQQRMLLEVAWEAIEDAGIAPDRLRGTATGVFAAIYNHDFLRYRYADPDQVVAHTSSGASPAIAAGRIAFLLDLRGPAVIFDTACSSSLVATHFACASLRSRECDLALVGGSGLILGPETFVSLSKWGMLAPDGRCKTFDAGADGFGRGEGCGVIVIKRLADALRDGDRVRSVIRGTAINQDGRSTDLTAPNGLAQQDVIRRALRNAQVQPRDVGYIEAHGTGTPLGDPIEVEALLEVLGDSSSDALPCALASVKANIGHLEAAAGVAGLIKATLVLERAAIPPQALFTALNPHLDLSGSRFYVPTQYSEWPRGPAPRIAGVSSFGFSGTNAHIVLEEPPRLGSGARSDGVRERLLVVTARDEMALKKIAARYAERVARDPDQLDDICYTAAMRRAHHEVRLAVSGDSALQIADRLREFVSGARSSGVASGRRQRARDARPVFVFSGQGPQSPRMGLELMESEPAFREALQACDEAVRRHGGPNLLEELAAPDGASRLGATEVAQPCIFALQVALAALWRSWGVAPAAVVGHSIGEVAAAHVSGCLSLDHAARLVVHRGRLMQRATGSGRMASIELPVADVEALVRAAGEDVVIGAFNAPQSCVISGTARAVEAVLEKVRASGGAWTLLPVDYAFHSPQMEPHAAELERHLEGLAPRAAEVPFLSTVTGGVQPGDRLGPDYWRRNVREPVRFAAAIDAALEAGHGCFLEIGPHPVLSQAVQRCAEGRDPPATLPSLRRGQPQRGTMLQALGGLFAGGLEVSWRTLHPRGNVVELPPYAWSDDRYAVPRFRDIARAVARSGRDSAHPLLGARLPLAGGPRIHETLLSLDGMPFLHDHAVGGRPLLPAACYVEMALELADALWGSGGRIEALAFDQPLLLDAAEPVQLQVIVDDQDETRARLRICSRVSGTDSWTEHATGTVLRAAGAMAADAGDAAAVRQRCPAEFDADAVYAAMGRIGPEFGPSFRVIEKLCVGPAEAWADVRAPQGLGNEPFRIHPVLLDACFQTAAGALGLLDAGSDAGLVHVPVGIESVDLMGVPGDALRIQALARRHGTDTSKVELRIWNDGGEFVAAVGGLSVRAVARSLLAARPSREAADPLWSTAWREVALARNQSPGGETWLLVELGGELGDALAGELKDRGATIRRHAPGSGNAPIESCAGVVLLTQQATNPAMPVAGEALQAGAERLCREANDLVTAALRCARPPRVMVVTCGAQYVDGSENSAAGIAQAALWGWRNSLALEQPALRAKAVDLDPDSAAVDGSMLAAEILADDGEDRIAYRRGRRLAARLVRADERQRPLAPGVERPTVRLEIERRGTLDALAIRPAQRRAPGAGEVEVRVHAAALNFRDVMNALGTYPGDPGPLGDECSGVVVRVGAGVTHVGVGDEVMAFMPGCLASHATGLATMVVRRPATVSAEQAAGVPVVFMTAAMALERIAGLKKGQRVLIHAAAGGVGLAAVALAQSVGAEIFATAGSEEKRRFLESLGVQHVMDSRSLAFSGRVLELTGGAGVDAVLNSLAGDFIAASLAVVRRGGHFLEIGKTGIWTPEQVAALGRDIKYSVIFLGEDRQTRPEWLGGLLQDLAGRIGSGELRVPPTKVFPIEAAASAFRYMAQARHIGKLVLRLPSADAIAIRPDATYLVTGGLGGLGLAAAAALVQGGARSLLLVGRSGRTEVAATDPIAGLEAAGCKVHVLACDVAQPQSVEQLDAALATLPALGGIVHAAGVLDDGPIEALGADRWQRVMAPKIAGSWNLHRLAQRWPVDFLVFYSAGAALLGSAGQANYAAANSAMDALAGWRRANGLPALSIHWGVWDEVGMAARLDARGRARWQSMGMDAIAPREGGRMLLQLLGWPTASIAAIPARWSAYAWSIPDNARRLFAELLAEEPARTAARPKSSQPTLQQALQGVAPRRRREMLMDRLAEAARRVLGVGSGFELPPDMPLRDLGLDSLMAVELRNAVGTVVGRALPATLLFDYPSIAALVDHLLGQLDLQQGPEAAAVPAARSNAAQAVAKLSESEAEAQLLAELGESGGGR